MLEQIRIYNFSDICSKDGLLIQIPKEGDVIVISGKNGTGKTSVLKLINAACSTRAYQFGIKDCDGDLQNMDVRFTYLDERDNLKKELKLGKKEDRFSYKEIIGGKEKAMGFWEFEALSKQVSKKFLPAVGSRVSNLKDIIEGGTKKDPLFSEKINSSIDKVIEINSKIIIEKPKKGSSQKKKATEKGKSVDEMFLGKRALAELFAELHSLDKGSIFIVDEVEQALHFDIHEKLLHEIKRVAKDRGIRVILTTHSPYLFHAANSSQRYLLRKSSEGIYCELGAFLSSKEDLEVKDIIKYIYITEDKKSSAILRKKLLINKVNPTNIYIIAGGGAGELFSRINDLKKIYADNYIAIFDPDIEESDINKWKGQVDTKYQGTLKWEYLISSESERKTPERLLLEFAFIENIISPEDLEKIYKSNPTDDPIVMVIKGLEEGSSLDGNSTLYKALYEKLIFNVGKEDDIIMAYLRS